ncbi:MAG: hypothetical protein LBL74_05115 [Bacteroidales bacterium]|jgi:hypothetical protein|nr:hypothetical protein [Bacteroidales bacterium]
MKKRLIIFGLVIVLIISLVIAANITAGNINVKQVEINIEYKSNAKMLTPDYVERNLISHFGKFVGLKRKAINTKEIEDYLYKMNFVEEAKVNIGILGKLEIKLIQSIPIAKLFFPNKKQPLYLNDKGKYCVDINGKAADVMIINGSISDSIGDIFLLSKKIFNDSLLSKTIDQIFVKKNKTFILVLKENLIINLGTIENIDNKLKRLKGFITESNISHDDIKKAKTTDFTFDDICIVEKE